MEELKKNADFEPTARRRARVTSTSASRCALVTSEAIPRQSVFGEDGGDRTDR